MSLHIKCISLTILIQSVIMITTSYIQLSNYDNYLLHFKVSYLHVEITLFDFELNARFSIK